MPESVPKRLCFLGLFDILGFSNIVKNDQLESVWRAYSDINRSTAFIETNLEELFKNMIIKVESFSDTFLMYTSDCKDKNESDIDMYFNSMLAVCDALFQSANGNCIPIRGAITFGEIIANEGIHIGKPIVEAYEMEQKQDWIGCWISEDAIKNVSQKLMERHMNGNLILKYKIPFKSGEIKDCYVFNWVHLPFEHDYDFGCLKKKPGHDWSSERKHLNTRNFIKYAIQNTYKQ